MRAKLITIFLVTLAVFVGILVWRTDDILYGDKLSFSEAGSRMQLSAVVKNLESEVRNLNDIMNLALPNLEQTKKDYSSRDSFRRIEMLGKISPPSVKNNRKEWQLSESFFAENSQVKTWAPQYIFLSLKTIKEENLTSKKSIMLSLLDPSRKPHLLLLTQTSNSDEYLVGLISAEVFQGLMDRLKGQASSVFIVNQQGQALGHTVPEYVGSSLIEDPMVSSIMNNADFSRVGIFKNLKGESVQGLYEQIGNTNIFAVITTPVNSLIGNRDSLKWQFIMMGMGLGLVALGVFVFLYRPEKEIIRIPSSAPIAGNSAIQPSGPNKMDAYVKVASALSHEMRGPLTSILGHVQLLKNQVGDGARANEHLEKIEREARGAREIVTKLQTFAGEGLNRTSKANLETVVLKALKNVDGKILGKGIKLQKNISSKMEMEISPDLMTKAIENILLNSIESMERAPHKNLEVNLKDDGENVVLDIKDSGDGISANDLPKIFDPFFTTKATTHHVGLGLATSLGIFKEFHGEVAVQSEKSQGTTVKVVFKASEMNAMAPASQPEVKKDIPRLNVAQLRVVEPAPPAPAPAASISPLLVDNSIEKMIDGDEESSLEFPPAPGTEFEELNPPVPAPEPVRDFSSKIDKPKIELKKKAPVSPLQKIEVAIRRPGEKSGDKT